MAEMQAMWDLENQLSSLQGMGTGAMLLRDPNTGQPGMVVPESKKEAAALKKRLSPTGDIPVGANPKAFVSQETQLPVTEKMLEKDTYNWDKDKIKELISAEQSGIDHQAQAMQNFKQMPLGVNLKPYAAFLDTAIKGGGKLADSMPEVETPEQRALKVQQLENLLQNQRGDLTKNSLGLLRAEIDKQGQRNERFQTSQLLKKETELQKDLDKSILQPMDEYQRIMGSMQDQISRGTLSSIGTAISGYVRKVGGQSGVLTNEDIALMMPKSLEATVARAEAWITGNPNVPLPKELSQALLGEMEISRKNATNVFNTAINTKKTLYSARQSYRDVMDREKGFGPQAFAEVQRRAQAFGGASAPAAAGGSPGGVMSPEEFFKQKK